MRRSAVGIGVHGEQGAAAVLSLLLSICAAEVLQTGGLQDDCCQASGVENKLMAAAGVFLDRLVVEQVDSTHWKLYEPLRYVSFTWGVINVPALFVTDFASTPHVVWSFGMPKSGIYDPAAVVHDYLYVMGGRLPGRSYTKAEADLIFKEAMSVLGVGRMKCWLMYRAVQMFGKGSFQA